MGGRDSSSNVLVAQWLVCLDYVLLNQRDPAHSGSMSEHKRQEEIIAKLKQMKIIPLKQEQHLVSIAELDKGTVLFPLDKSNRYAKSLALVLNDVPLLDDQLLNFIEDNYPRRNDSIKKLLIKLGRRRQVSSLISFLF